MKKIIIALLLQTSFAFCQQEASVWYFGQNAGLKFENDGSVTPLSDGQLNTEEGCSSIADSSGNLLFYTDGRTVWDSNHVRMPNGDFLAGTELFGDISSTQSGIIIPKPGSSNIYYIFTVDEPHHSNAAVYPNAYFGTYPNYLDDGSVPTTDDGYNNGFNYSVVDLSITGSNGSIGDVISRNNHLVTYNPNPTGEEIKYKCSEKITAIKNEATNEYWVVTQFVDKFYAFKVTASGVITTPVVSTIGPNITLSGYRRNALGYLKASPNGQRLAIAHHQNGTVAGGSSFTTGSVLVYDFNDVTGAVSNEQVVLNTNIAPYGVEFSPDSNKLYATYRVNANPEMELSQFNLFAPNIEASKVVIYNSSNYLFALQLAINNKIYLATGYDFSLGVINNPNATGLACSYVDIGQPLATGRKVKLGLPPFITSFFNVGIMTSDVCVGSTASFTLNTPLTLTSVLWNFGDGSTSTATNPNHVYATAGTYTVTVTATGSAGTATSTREITIYPLPTLLSSTVSLKQCDDNNDGFSSFNLNESTSLLVSSTTGLTFSYYETTLDAQNSSNAITNPATYTNQIVSNDIVFVRIQNVNGCFRVAQLDLIVSTTLIPVSFQRVFTVCDDVASGSTTDGISTFDFSSVTAEIQALYPPGQLLAITYYKNITDALAEVNAIANTSNYSNVGYANTQNIIVRVDSQLNNECLGLGHHITLNVERIPIVQPLIIRHCDDNQDGVYGFDTSTLQTTLLNGLTGVSVSYTNSSGTPIVMSNPFTSTSQTITATVTNTTTTACSYSSTIQFIVDDLPEAFPINASLTSVCDDETDPALQNGIYPFDTSTFESTIIGSQTGMIVKYYDGFGNLLPSPLPNPFNSANQTLLAEVSNTVNASCKATQTIPLVVHEKPRINLTGSELVCSNDPSFTKVINAGLINTSTIGNYNYSWYFNGAPIAGAINYNLTVNTEGVYTVDVENVFGCVSTRTITVTASNAATIDAIEVNDLVNNNSILILVSGDGTYTYSIDGANYQTSNSFNNLLPGIYTVYINDELGCGIKEQEISILGIPKFFTPNGDGTNDYWNIDGVNQHFNAKATIRIYDRFGKLLKQIKPLSVGWDGTYNGYTVLSDDYWYVIELEDGRIVKGHFALVR